MRNTRLPEVLHYQLLLREPLVAVVPEGHPLAETPGGALRFQHLAQEPFVFFSREVGTALYDEILLLLGKAGITRISPRKWGSDDHHRLVSAGLGVSILPASFARVRVDGVRYLPLAEPDATTEVWLVHHRRR